MYTRQEAEGKRLKNPNDTITEGIGINRQTQNFSKARIDGAFQGTDREAVEMASMEQMCISTLEVEQTLLYALAVIAVCTSRGTTCFW